MRLRLPSLRPECARPRAQKRRPVRVVEYFQIPPPLHVAAPGTSALRGSKDFASLFRRIPTGFRHSAQGCEARATLGKRGKGNLNPNGVAANDLCDVTQPRWGWKALPGIPRVASPTRQPLGWRPESRWDSQRSAEHCSARMAAQKQPGRAMLGAPVHGDRRQHSHGDPSFHPLAAQ